MSTEAEGRLWESWSVGGAAAFFMMGCGNCRRQTRTYTTDAEMRAAWAPHACNLNVRPIGPDNPSYAALMEIWDNPCDDVYDQWTYIEDGSLVRPFACCTYHAGEPQFVNGQMVPTPAPFIPGEDE